MPKRAERRFEERKRRLKAKKTIKEQESYLENLYRLKGKVVDPLHRTLERRAGKAAATPCMCSNPLCCGNPRHTIGRKIEKVSELRRQKLPLKELKRT